MTAPMVKNKELSPATSVHGPATLGAVCKVPVNSTATTSQGERVTEIVGTPPSPQNCF